MKKIITLMLALALSVSFVGCKASNADATTLLSSSEVSSEEPASSEYPSSVEPLSSEASSEVSSIISSVEEKNESSKPPASSKAQKKAAASSKAPVSSKAPASSKAPSSAPPSSAPPASSKPIETANNAAEMKAVWISFLEFSSFKGSSESGFTNTLSTYFDKCVNMGLNTVIVQVRPHGDSFYASQYYPWSKCVSGTMGTAVSYDPLKIMVDLAHSKGLSIHAWVNPYRTMTDAEMALVDSSFPVKQWYNSANRSNYMVQLGKDARWWLKPGNTEAQQLIRNGVKEIVSNYAVDGVHLDDYFYGGDLKYYGDSHAQAQANTTALIKGLHDDIKAIRSSVQFGVSPSGAYREKNALPSSDIGYLSTDLQKWCQNPGYIDYVMPQLYWGYNHISQPFTMTLNKWENLVTEPSVKLYVGVAPSGLPAAEIERQLGDINLSSKATGYCLYRYEYMHGVTLP